MIRNILILDQSRRTKSVQYVSDQAWTGRDVQYISRDQPRTYMDVQYVKSDQAW